MKNYIDLILAHSMLTSDFEAEIDIAKEELIKQGRDLKNIYFSYGVNALFCDLQEVFELLPFFQIDLYDENKQEAKTAFERISSSLLSGDLSFLSSHIQTIKSILSFIEEYLYEDFDLLTDEERKRLNEAFNCYIEELNYSSIIMSVSSIESRLYTLMYSKSLDEKLKDLTLGQLIKEYSDHKSTYHNVIPKKHQPLLEYCNTYRVFSVHPKEEKITRSNATVILCMTCSFLFDKNMKPNL